MADKEDVKSDIRINHDYGDSYLEYSYKGSDGDFSSVQSDRSTPTLIPSKRKYKISYPPNMEVQIKRLRIAFDAWKEIILPIKNILLWEQQWHPYAIIGCTTAVFMLFWLLDPSVLTTIASLGIFVTLSDYFVPMLSASLFKPEKWNSDKERELEQLCVSLVLFKTQCELTFAGYCRLRTTKPRLYMAITLASLGVAAWVGMFVDNLLLMYLLVIIALLIPGMEQNGLLHKGAVTSGLKSLMSMVDNARAKLSETRISQKKTN